MAAIPIERDAVVWARLRMRLCPSLAVTSWGFEPGNKANWSIDD